MWSKRRILEFKISEAEQLVWAAALSRLQNLSKESKKQSRFRKGMKELA